jgi:hypothetical protein
MNAREQERADGGRPDAVERFDAVARFSTVTVEMPDGRRQVTRTDHATGEVEVTVKPPRRRPSRSRRW